MYHRAGTSAKCHAGKVRSRAGVTSTVRTRPVPGERQAARDAKAAAAPASSSPALRFGVTSPPTSDDSPFPDRLCSGFPTLPYHWLRKWCSHLKLITNVTSSPDTPVRCYRRPLSFPRASPTPGTHVRVPAGRRGHLVLPSLELQTPFLPRYLGSNSASAKRSLRPR